MQIQVNRLRAALELLEGVASPKVKVEGKRGRGKGSSTASSTLPILGYALLKDGKAVATDLETAVTVELPEATEACLLPLKQTSQLLKYVNGNDMLSIDRDTRTTLSWSDGKASLETKDVDDYPIIPSIVPVIRASFLGDLLMPNLLSMLTYSAADSSRPVLNGVSLFLGEPLEIAAGDGFRMAFKSLPLSLPSEGGIQTAVLSRKAVAILGHAWDKAPRSPVGDNSIADLATRGKIGLEISSTMLKAEFGVVSVLTRLVEGRPPSFKQLIPSDPPNKVQFYAPDFELALRRMTSAAKEGIGAVRMMWQGNSMKLSTDGGDAGQMELTIPAQPLDGAGKVAVNINYLLEYVKGKSGVVTMGVTTTSGPVLFNYSNFPIVVIMPMVVSWPDDLPTPAPTSEPPEDNLEGSEEPVDEQPDEETMPVD